MAYNPSSAALRACLEAGLAAHSGGDLQRALNTFRQAVGLEPDNADALNLLGATLVQLGQAEEAVGHLERASRAQRSNPMILANLAQAYMAAARYDDAHDAFRKASRIDPKNLQFQLGSGAALAMHGRLEEAEAIFRRLAARYPNAAPVWLNLGNVLRDRGQLDEAIAAYRSALAADPRLVDARNAIGSVLHSMQRFAEAEEQYRLCVAAAPDFLTARYNLASVVIDMGRFDEGERLSRDLIALAPDDAEAHTILSAAIGHQGRLLDALACDERAIALAPHSVKVLQGYAATLMDVGHTDRGLHMFGRVLATNDSDAARQLLGSALLAAGQLHDGWNEYTHRPAAIRFREKYPALALTRSLPSPLQGKHLCVLREQGLGDEIFFLRYAPLLAARGAHIIYRASNKIAGMLSRVPALSSIVEDMSPLPQADANLMVGDLPYALGETASSPVRCEPRTTTRASGRFKRRIALWWPDVPPSLVLRPLEGAIAEIRARLAALGPPPYVGITWRAGTAPEAQSSVSWLLYKTVPLERLAQAMRGAPGTFLALQRHPAAGEIAALARALGRPVHDMSDLNEALEGMLALLSVIDDYIGVSNTNMHLRAAVGKTARVLIPAPAEWRWLQSGRASPWFPGFSLYRQSLQGDWSRALNALERDLGANSVARRQSNPA